MLEYYMANPPLELSDDLTRYYIDAVINRGWGYNTAGHYSMWDVPKQEHRGLYKAVQHTMLSNDVWGFDLTHWQQELRVQRYVPGDRMDTHVDYAANDGTKLAMVHCLQAADTGGEIVLGTGEVRTVINMAAGETLLVPGFVPHGVSMVTNGERIVLLGWMTGPRLV